MTGPSYIARYPEPLPGGRAIMRVDVVMDGELTESYTEGSPAPIETVRDHAGTTWLDGPPRPQPIRLDGCTCSGIGDTGAHRRGCMWAARP